MRNRNEVATAALVVDVFLPAEDRCGHTLTAHDHLAFIDGVPQRLGEVHLAMADDRIMSSAGYLVGALLSFSIASISDGPKVAWLCSVALGFYEVETIAFEYLGRSEIVRAVPLAPSKQLPLELDGATGGSSCASS